jgi:hypothetical protein
MQTPSGGIEVMPKTDHWERFVERRIWYGPPLAPSRLTCAFPAARLIPVKMGNSGGHSLKAVPQFIDPPCQATP